MPLGDIIVKLKNFTPGVKILEFKFNKIKISQKVKNFTNHLNSDIFGGEYFFGGQNFRVRV